MSSDIVTPRKKGWLIDLEPGEADVLSFVAALAADSAAKPHLMNVLSTSTERAREIGKVILGEVDGSNPSYVFMAKRFTSASERNAKDAEILWPARPKGDR